MSMCTPIQCVCSCIHTAMLARCKDQLNVPGRAGDYYYLALCCRSFVSGRRIEIERSIRESRMDESQLETVLLAASYKTYQIPSDYLPR